MRNVLLINSSVQVLLGKFLTKKTSMSRLEHVLLVLGSSWDLHLASDGSRFHETENIGLYVYVTILYSKLCRVAKRALICSQTQFFKHFPKCISLYFLVLPLMIKVSKQLLFLITIPPPGNFLTYVNICMNIKRSNN